MIEKAAVFTIEIPILALLKKAFQMQSYAKCLLLLLLLLLLYLSPLFRIFIIIYLKQAMFLGYIVLQVFCIYNLYYMQCYFTREICFVLLH